MVMGGISWGGRRSLPKLFGRGDTALYVLDLDDRHAADAPKFKPLMETTVKNFAVDEVSAGSAYLG